MPVFLELSRTELLEVVQGESLENPLLLEGALGGAPTVDEPVLLGELDNLPLDLTAVIGDRPHALDVAADEASDFAPDLVVHEIGGAYIVTLNEDGLRLGVNVRFLEDVGLFENPDDEVRQYLDAKLRSAVWLIASICAWQSALRDVARAVMRAQQDFLDGRLKYPRPLSLLAVSGNIGMHVSSIRRVIASKYVETPRGLFDLTFFFDLRTGSA